MEDLQISPPGKKPNDFLNGFYDLCGHPIGASGLRMLYEVYNQLLRLWPEERLVKKPKMGLTHNLGGVPSQNVCSISIFGLDKFTGIENPLKTGALSINDFAGFHVQFYLIFKSSGREQIRTGEY